MTYPALATLASIIRRHAWPALPPSTGRMQPVEQTFRGSVSCPASPVQMSTERHGHRQWSAGKISQKNARHRARGSGVRPDGLRARNVSRIIGLQNAFDILTIGTRVQRPGSPQDAGSGLAAVCRQREDGAGHPFGALVLLSTIVASRELRMEIAFNFPNLRPQRDRPCGPFQ